ncbi:MAG TPA: inositol monophosphatase family protein, partial [Nannocystis sp.]
DGRRESLRTGASDMTALRLASSKSHASPKIEGVMRALAIPEARNFRMGSVGVKVSTIARGVTDLYVHASRGTKLWDSCAPHAVLAAAGGQMTDVRGEPLVYDPRHLGNDFGLLASHGPHHAEIAAALAPVIGDWFT